MRFKLLAASFALLITQSALAGGQVNPPSCPTVDAFKNTGVTAVMRDENGAWVALEWKNRFGTEQEWTFGVGDVTADSASNALAKGNAAISALVYKYGPGNMGTEKDPMWVCAYIDPNSDIYGAAFTPPLTPEINKIIKFLHKN